MKIALIAREYKGSQRAGGIATYIEHLAYLLHDMGHRVYVISANDDVNKTIIFRRSARWIELRLSGGDFALQSNYSGFWSKVRIYTHFISYRWKLRHVVSRLGLDIVEVADYEAEGLFISRNVKKIVRCHTSRSFNLEKLKFRPIFSFEDFGRIHIYLAEYIEMKRAKKISFCCEDYKKIVCSHYRLTKGQYSIIPNGINILGEHNISLNQDLKKNILFVGSCVPTKGLFDLLDVVVELDEISPLKVDIAGKCNKHNLSRISSYSSANYLGLLPNEEVLDMYSECLVVCLPSYWENSPLTVIEAMLQGALVIAGNRGGAKDIISHGINGFLIEPGNHKMLKNTIAKVLEMSLLDRSAMQVAARQRILDHFSSEKMVKHTMDFYKN